MKKSKSLQNMIIAAQKINNGERVAVGGDMAATIIKWYSEFETKIHAEPQGDGVHTILWK